jgi:hypothetical protein
MFAHPEAGNDNDCIATPAPTPTPTPAPTLAPTPHPCDVATAAGLSDTVHCSFIPTTGTAAPTPAPEAVGQYCVSEAAAGANGQYVSSAAERSNQAKWSYDYLQQLLADEYINIPERSRVYVKDATAATGDDVVYLVAETSEASSGHAETRWIIAKGIYVLYRATTTSVDLISAPVYPTKWMATQHANDDADDLAKVVKGICPAAADPNSVKRRRRLRADRA